MVTWFPTNAQNWASIITPSMDSTKNTEKVRANGWPIWNQWWCLLLAYLFQIWKPVNKPRERWQVILGKVQKLQLGAEGASVWEVLQMVSAETKFPQLAYLTNTSRKWKQAAVFHCKDFKLVESTNLKGRMSACQHSAMLLPHWVC